MYWSTASVLRLASPLLVAIAIAGYLAGHQHATAAPGGAFEANTQIAYGTNVLLEYPGAWLPTAAKAAPAIPGLPIAHAMLLAPAGDGVHSGLLSGQIASESPLPAGFLSQLSSAPHTEVVDLLAAQAYRYAHLSPRGYAGALDLYVTPALAGSQTVLACYASDPLSPSMRQCRQIVAGLTLTDSPPVNLTPDPNYGAHLKHVIDTLDAQRLELRRKMAARPAASSFVHLATTLAAHFGTAASAITALEPPRSASFTQMMLTRSILSARRAYDALAAAALAASSGRSAAAQTRVTAAEASVDAALESYKLLGYTRPS